MPNPNTLFPRPGFAHQTGDFTAPYGQRDAACARTSRPIALDDRPATVATAWFDDDGGDLRGVHHRYSSAHVRSPVLIAMPLAHP